MRYVSSLICCAVLMVAGSLKSQIDCNAFCIEGIRMDSVPGTIWINLSFAGDPNAFINYPHFPYLLNADGDTVATGTLFFFGQFGGTTQEYPVSTNLTELPDPFEGTAIFNYDTNFCALPFPCIINALDEPSPDLLAGVFPNPASTVLFVRTKLPLRDGVVTVSNTAGVAVLARKHLIGSDHSIDISMLPTGQYILTLGQDDHREHISFIVID